MSSTQTILVIDDNLTSLTSIRAVLQSFFEVCLAKNAEVAEAILKTTKIDLILLDIEMPGISGLELLKMIREDEKYRKIPVIIVSSHGTTDVIIDSKILGAIDFIVKPVATNVLLDKVHMVLKGAPVKTPKKTFL